MNVRVCTPCTRACSVRMEMSGSIEANLIEVVYVCECFTSCNIQWLLCGCCCLMKGDNKNGLVLLMAA